MTEKKYRLSFTAASLRLPEMSKLAKLYLDDEASSVNKEQVIRGRNTPTTEREFREIKHRIDTLTTKQITILAHSDVIGQKHIALLAMCKLYGFLRDFIIEVLREKAIAFDYQITEGEYATFFKRKCETHPELEDLTDTTAKKIKQVTYKILEQTGLIDNVASKKINTQILDHTVISAVAEEDPEWLKVFLLTDYELVNLRA
ncbi:DUF1819 family protein [Hymenobacter sp. BT491]|uniref:DUF1819 family protein n=1 Tax=Hymenobacter sp. BT491 TaxID=2766779 RepID=UPI001653B724|nr:DUF1819 family protein [Hymenobacter sp. BT491]MBC6992231.1 DUF1819 family protein [Hymenobacter sp. BT491]